MSPSFHPGVWSAVVFVQPLLYAETPGPCSPEEGHCVGTLCDRWQLPPQDGLAHRPCLPPVPAWESHVSGAQAVAQPVTALLTAM